MIELGGQQLVLLSHPHMLAELPGIKTKYHQALGTNSTIEVIEELSKV